MVYREGIIKETEFFTTSELAKKLKMNVQVITRKVQAGEIEAYKIGKDWRIPEQSVYEWLEDLSNKHKPHSRKVSQKAAIPAPGSGLPTSKRDSSKRMFLLEYILAQFEPSRSYSEEEVDHTIARYHNDSEAIRDEFLTEHMMEMVDGQYRRLPSYHFSD